MILTHPEIERVFNTRNGMYNTLVIENQTFLLRVLRDICDQIQGSEGVSVLSREHVPIPISKFVELIDTFVPFNLNRKTLLAKITANLAKQAVSPENFESTSLLLAQIEQRLNRIASDFPCEIEFTGVSIAAIIKACAPEIQSGVASLAEMVYNYMELVRELDVPKLFITLNMRSFVPDNEMELFARTVMLHGFDILGIESREYPRLSNEQRTTIDEDLCEI